MDEFDIPTGIPLFSTPPSFIKPGEVMTSNITSFPNERLYQPKPGDNVELVNKYNAILSIPDEDELSAKFQAKIMAAELKEKKYQERIRQQLEEAKEKYEDSKIGKYNSKCKSIIKLLMKDGFSEDDCKRLCGSCKYPTPYHSNFREIDKSTPSGFSLNCKKCEKNGKARQFNIETGEEITEGAANQRSKIHRMTHAFNNKCKCGKIFVISDIAGLEDANYKKHLKGSFHKQWEVIYYHQTSSTNKHIIFEVFSINQLRTIIQNNKDDKGKVLVSNYSKKNKEEIIKVLKEVKTKLNIDYSILPKANKEEKPIGYVNEVLQEDYDETLHFSSDEESLDDEESD